MTEKAEVTLLEKLFKHVLILYVKAETDREIYGTSFIELSDRKIEVRDPLSFKGFDKILWCNKPNIPLTELKHENRRQKKIRKKKQERRQRL